MPARLQVGSKVAQFGSPLLPIYAYVDIVTTKRLAVWLMVDPNASLSEVSSGDDMTLMINAVDVSSWPGSLQAGPTQSSMLIPSKESGLSQIGKRWRLWSATVTCSLRRRRHLRVFFNKVAVSNHVFSTLITIANKVKQAARVVNSLDCSFPDLPSQERAAVGDSGMLGSTQADFCPAPKIAIKKHAFGTTSCLPTT